MIKLYNPLKVTLHRVQAILLAVIFTSATLTSQALAYVDTDFFAGNDILFYDPTCAYTGGNTTLDGNGIKEKIWNFLHSQGLNDVQTAGVMGNMEAESGFVPTRHQSTSDVYTNGGSGNAWGLVQWDGGRRYTAPDKGVLGKLKKDHSELVKYTDIQYDWARNKGAQAKIPQSDLDAILSFELNYLVQESKSRPVSAHGFGDAGNEWNTMKLQKNVENSTVFWHNNFEVSADSAARVIQTRGGFAKDIFDQFAGKTTTSSGSTSGSSSPSGSSTGSATAPTVFIDPGHGGSIASYIDAQSGFKTSESHNTPETEDVLDVANRVKTALEGAGYKVAMARTTNNQQVKFRDRSNAAAAANASIGISIHTTPGNINEAWPQRLGTYREYNGHRETFSEKDTAQKSETFAGIFAKTRTAAENHTVTTDPGNVTENDSFHRAGIDSKGNTPLVELWSPKVPWVYNEIGQDKGAAISDKLKQKYADGIIKGVEESIPFTKTDQCGNTPAVTGTLANYIMAYAFHDYKSPPNWDLKSDDYGSIKGGYKAAVAKAQKDGRYVGGGAHPGVDCGGFVTTLLVDSGFEPKYNSSGKGGNVVEQHKWADQHWQKVGSGSSIDVAKLQPGDVAYSSDDGHTFVWAGKIDGFHSKIASASYSTTGLSWRAPMAGKEDPTGGVTWYRKK